MSRPNVKWLRRTQKLDAYVEWDGRQVRVGLLRRRRLPELLVAGQASVEAGDWASEAARAIRLLAGEQPIAGLTLVLGRAVTAVHEVTVPSAPDEELPGMVRFQAIRDLGVPPEKAHLDYCLIAPGQDATQTALVVSVDDELWQRAEDLARRVDTTLQHVYFRPLLTARLGLAASRGLVAEPTMLVVQPLSDGCECVVMHDGWPVLVRGVRLGSAGQEDELLQRECRRMLVVAEQRVGAATVALVYPGPAAISDRLSAVAQRLGMPVFSFEPFAGARLATEVEQTVAAAPGEWAALAAVLRGQASGTVDLAQPKLPEQRRRLPSRPVVIGGSVAAAAFLVLAAWSQWNVRTLDAQIELYRAQERQLDRFLRSADPFMKKYRAVADWVGTDADEQRTVLDLVGKLSEEFPDTSELYLQSLTLRRTEKGEFTMVVEGYAKSPQAVAEFHARLNRGTVFRARPRGGVQRVPRRSEYPWHFESELTLVRDHRQAGRTNGSGRRRERES